MKTINGKNKSERQINKTQKYLNIELKNNSNNYFEIESFDSSKAFAFLGEAKLIDKYQSFAFNPLNSKDGKAIWKKTFAVMKATLDKKNFFYIFNSYEGDHQKLLDLSEGHDDIIKLSSISTKIFVEKN